MDEKVVRIFDGAPIQKEYPPNLEVITLLKAMLNAAESGRMQAVLAIGWNCDDTISSGWQGAHNAAFTLLGGLEAMKIEYVLKEFQRRS